MSDKSPYEPPFDPPADPPPPVQYVSEDTDLPARPAVAVSIDGRIAEDKTCRECGYNLRGLKTDGICPECGGEVSASLLGHELLYASLPWLKTIARGFRYMRNGLLLALASILVIIFVLTGDTIPAELLSAIGVTDTERLLPSLTRYLAMLMFLGIAVAILYASAGFVLATRVEPRVAIRKEGFSARRAARILVLLVVILFGLARTARHIVPQYAFGDIVVLLITPALATAALLAAVAFVRYTVALLERTAEDYALKSARDTLVIAYLAVLLYAAVFAIQIAVGTKTPSPEGADYLETLKNTLAGCGNCVNLLMLVGLLQIVWRMNATMRDIVLRAEKGA